MRLLLDAGDDIVFHYNCLRVVGLDEVACVLLLCLHHIYVVDQYRIEDSGCIVRCSDDGAAPPQRVLRFAYTDARFVLRRRYSLRPCALEFFFRSGTGGSSGGGGGAASLLLVVNKAQRQQIHDHIVSRCTALEAGGDPLALAGGGLLQRGFGKRGVGVGGGVGGGSAQQAQLAAVTERWRAGLSSNFDFLMDLNYLSGRSLNDLSSYPVGAA